MPKCLVLGANGFIASHLVDSLVSKGHEVRAFGRFHGDPQYNDSPKIEKFPGDFLNRNDLAEALQEIDYVFHFISTTTPVTAENDPLIDIETNIRMSVELFQECEKARIKKIIFASTGGAIYGEGSNKPFKETDLPLPVSPYAIGKLSIEHYLRYFKVKYGLDSLVFRISNPYGERQPTDRKQGVLPIFIDAMQKDETLTVYGDGSMVRDYIYVKDVSDIITEVFDKPTEHGVYNIGSGRGNSVSEIIVALQEVLDKEATVKYVPTPPTFVHTVVLDTRRIENEFRIGATTSLDQGLRATLHNENKNR